MAPTVLYDACVLYPAPLRDLLMRLAMANLFQARWTDEIHDEWTRNVAANRPDVSPSSLDRCRRLMDEHVPDSLVTGYEPLIPTLTLPDPDDRHVVAAALQGRADMIVTANLRDFPADVLDPIGLEVQDPDTFLLNQLDLEPDLTIATLRGQAAATRRPAITTKVLLEHLAKCGVPRFASAAAAQLWREA